MSATVYTCAAGDNGCKTESMNGVSGTQCYCDSGDDCDPAAEGGANSATASAAVMLGAAAAAIYALRG